MAGGAGDGGDIRTFRCCGARRHDGLRRQRVGHLHQFAGVALPDPQRIQALGLFGRDESGDQRLLTQVQQQAAQPDAAQAAGQCGRRQPGRHHTSGPVQRPLSFGRVAGIVLISCAAA